MTMLLADVSTLLLAILALSLTLGLAVGLASQDSRSQELRDWARAMALHGFCYLLFMQRGTWPDWLTIVGANAMYAGSFALMLHAVAKFKAVPLPTWLFWAPVVTVTVVFALLQDQQQARIACGSAIFLFQQLAILRLILRNGEPGGTHGRQLLVAGIATISAVFAVRGVAALLGIAPIANLTAQTPLQTLSYLLGIVALVLASVGFVFMVKERIERQASQSRHLLSAIFDSSDESVAMSDQDGNLLAINRIGAERFNSTPQQMIGKSMTDVMPPDVAASRLAAIRRVAALQTSETLVDTRAGHVYRLTFYPVAGEQNRVVVFAADITEKQMAEATLRQRLEETIQLNIRLEEAHNQLLQSEKMASIGQLAAGVAHELNNPIGFVHSNLGTLENYLRDIFQIAAACERAAAEAANPADFARIDALKAEKDFEYIKTDIFQLLAESIDGLDRVKKIVKDLKDFSRPGETDWQWADLNQGLESTLNIVWNELKYKCTVSKDYGKLPRIRCLPSQLNQVFMNLLVNAAQSIETKGEIAIATRCLGEDAVQVVIADTGKGIPAENMNRLFEPFFTTKPIGKGTGLGLSIAWGIVAKHHGRIEVASEVGRGTTFTLTLPVDPPPDASAVTPAPTL